MLYRQRDDLGSARRAAVLWSERGPADYDAAWKLSRVDYWIGTHGAENDARKSLEQGVSAGETAIRIDPNRPEGHFWLAADLGAQAEKGGMQALRSGGRIRRELERAMEIDPVWEEASAETALGQWYLEAPRLLGGGRSKAREHLMHVLTQFPGNKNALSLLAQALVEDGQADQARALLQRILDEPGNPEWEPEDRELRRQAVKQLNVLSNAKQ